MIKLDDNLLAELGLAALPPDDKKKLLAHIYETLEMRVGVELAKQMSEAQLAEFEEFITRNDEAGALKWLETNFPHYKDVVANEFEKLKAEIKQIAPQILASAQAPAPAPQPQSAQPYYYPPYPQTGGGMQPSGASQMGGQGQQPPAAYSNPGYPAQPAATYQQPLQQYPPQGPQQPGNGAAQSDYTTAA